MLSRHVWMFLMAAVLATAAPASRASVGTWLGSSAGVAALLRRVCTWGNTSSGQAARSKLRRPRVEELIWMSLCRFVHLPL